MPSHSFRVVHPTNRGCGEFETFPQSESVPISAGETFALLLHAARTNRAWLRDFADETIEVSRDMYEILLAYKRVAQEENARAA